MDAWFESGLHDPVVVTGAGCELLAAEPLCSPWLPTATIRPWLKNVKSLKFMGKQDQLAVVAAGKALRAAAIDAASCGGRIGLFLAVGYIPFDRADLELIGRSSAAGGAFSMELFSTVALERVNPLLTFRCLPNMPAYHVSANFGITGRYFVTYPGAGQFYTALEQAVFALNERQVDVALLGGVADQSNFLVRHHLRRIGFDGDTARDIAAFVCLERAGDASARCAGVRAQLLQAATTYQPHDVWQNGRGHHEAIASAEMPIKELASAGAASLPYALSLLIAGAVSGVVSHELATVDGISAASRWELPA